MLDSSPPSLVSRMASTHKKALKIALAVGALFMALIVLIVYYAVRMNQIDAKYGVAEDEGVKAR